MTSYIPQTAGRANFEALREPPGSCRMSVRTRAMAGTRKHCTIDRVIKGGELQKARDFLHLQNIDFPDTEAIAHVKEPCGERDCPHRQGFGPHMLYCTNPEVIDPLLGKRGK
jgi:hypothetical protein